MVKRDNYYYINKIIENIDFILRITKDMTYKEFFNDEVVNSAVGFKLIQISENINKLDEDFKKSYPNIEWVKIKGLRNRIVHDYGHVELDIIYDTIIKNLSDLKSTFENVKH